LNQISGRELRVARIRRDRYIRPVYRESDLKDYLDWTRATATHLSSSKAIEQAVENLDDRFNDVLQVFNNKLEQVSQDQKSWMKSEFESLPAKFPAQSQPETHVHHDTPWHREDKLLRSQSEKILDLQKTIKGLQTSLRDVQSMLTLMIPEMKELSVAQKSLRFDFDQKVSAVQAMIKDMAGEASLGTERSEAFFAEARSYFNPIPELGDDELIAEPVAPRPQAPKRNRSAFHKASRRYTR